MEPDERLAILRDMRDIPFLPPCQATPGISHLVDQYGCDVSASTPHRIAFSGSVLPRHATLVWSSANVLPQFADPSRLVHLGVEEKKQMMAELEVTVHPSCEAVTANLVNVCAATATATTDEISVATMKGVLRQLYEYLQKQDLQAVGSHVVRTLRQTACIPVEEGRRLVQPTYTALNMLADDQIKPYLYKVPSELGEYHAFFVAIGAEQSPTAAQYAHVLVELKSFTKTRPLHPNELELATKAMRGLFLTLQNNDNTLQTSSSFKNKLCLLSDECQLLDSTKLVYNDSPTFYDRVPDSSKLHFLIDLRQCNIRNKLAEETVELLPPGVRPTLLSSLVVETLVQGAEARQSKAGLAKQLEDKIKSAEFHKAVLRLIKHHQHTAGKTSTCDSDEYISAVVDRLSVIEIFAVPDMKTHLLYRNKPIESSETSKTCHVCSHLSPGGDTMWQVYVEEGASLDHELLIPLANVINTILGGMLKEAVLFIIPLLTSPVGVMNRTLNKLNIKEDNYTVNESSRTPALYPVLGDTVSEAHRRLLSRVSGCLEPDEWAGYQQSDDQSVVYCRVHEEVIGGGGGAASSDTDRFFLVHVAPGNIVQIAATAQLFRFTSPDQ